MKQIYFGYRLIQKYNLRSNKKTIFIKLVYYDCSDFSVFKSTKILISLLQPGYCLCAISIIG